MGARTFDKEQLHAMGAVSLDEFAACLSIALAPTRAAAERTLAPLSRALRASIAMTALSELSHDKSECTVATPVAAPAAGSALAHSLAHLKPSQRRTHVEASVLRVVRELTGAPSASLTAETPLMEAGVDSLASTELVSRLRSLSGLQLPPTSALNHPTARTLALHLIDLIEERATSDSDDQSPASAHVTSFTTSVTLGRAMAPPTRLSRPIVLLLSFIRSGSSLLQLCLNAHQQLYAGQELFLLLFDSMRERRAALSGTDYEEGLLATIMELRGCTLAEATAFIADTAGDCPTWRLYQMLQELCEPRVLVDKTPPNASHPMILQRSCEIFAAPRYLHLVRHPYAAIASGLQLQRDILGNLSTTWDAIEGAWFDTNLATRDFLLDNEPAAKLTLRCDAFASFLAPSQHSPPSTFLSCCRYEDFVRNPEAATRRVCAELLRIEWEPAMADPYATHAVDSFKAVHKFASTDPKLLRRRTIDAASADKWRDVVLPKSLQPSTKVLAKLFDYELLPEMPDGLVWLSRNPAHSSPIVVVHDFTGMLWGLEEFAGQLHAPCLGIQCSMQLIDGCKSVQELAWRYIRLLPQELLQRRVRLVAYSFGCRIAYRMACALDLMGKDVQLVLLDGPAGPSGPPRMGGHASAVAERIRSRVSGESAPPITKGGTAVRAISPDGDAIESLVDMMVLAGSDAAIVATSLIELPDREDVPVQPLLVPVLYVSAEASDNRTNGTVESAKRCLPRLQQVIVAGGHFDFLQQSSSAVSTHVDRFFANDVT